MTDKGVPKPSTIEDEYFVREDAEKKRHLAREMKNALAAEELKRLKQLHWMHCPKCGMEMHEVRMKGRRDFDVDACFSCGGVFLSKDEIDVIAHPKQKGIMAAILNWFRDETEHPLK
jgi:Zn-finger nucleic acid-binding protein